IVEPPFEIAFQVPQFAMFVRLGYWLGTGDCALATQHIVLRRSFGREADSVCLAMKGGRKVCDFPTLGHSHRAVDLEVHNHAHNRGMSHCCGADSWSRRADYREPEPLGRWLVINCRTQLDYIGAQPDAGIIAFPISLRDFIVNHVCSPQLRTVNARETLERPCSVAPGEVAGDARSEKTIRLEREPSGKSAPGFQLEIERRFVMPDGLH